MKKLNTHWDKLRIFYEVAKIGSLNAAAELLNISQPAISRTIGILEDYLDIRLFERLPRGVVLTRQGEVLFEAIGKMALDLNEAQLLLEQEEKEPIGPLRLAATAGFAALYLPFILADFLNQYPQILFSIHGTDDVPNLHSDEVDAVISPFIQEDDSLIQTYLTTYHLKLFASQEYIKKFGVPEKPSDLAFHRLLSFGDHKTLHPFSQVNWHLTLGAKKGETHHPYLMINSAIGLGNCAALGLGIASISEEHPLLNSLNLVNVLPDVPGPTIEAYFIYSTRLRNVRRIQVLRDYLVKTLSQRPQVYPSRQGEIGDKIQVKV